MRDASPPARSGGAARKRPRSKTSRVAHFAVAPELRDDARRFRHSLR